MTGKTDEMKKVRDEVVNLTTSPLYEYRISNGYHAVLGEGSHDAHFVFIGEAPGKNEAEQGRPFCGAAGKILDEVLQSVGINRADIYITNIVKDRPPQNRDPLPEEIKAYGPFLDRQIDIIQPKVIVTLGRYAMNYIMEKFGLQFEIEPISKAHGKVYTTKTLFGDISIVPMYHPAAAIYTRELKETLKEDFKVLKQLT
ncbi:uracil-DNA glycosylase [Candidatus Kaiserbacteria bacterium]|nr:uracil-DNA glycosylase [Candidatus Kaiserbacteria bacterium]